MFEDAEYMPISRLIASYYNKGQVLFAGGNGNIFHAMCVSCKPQDSIVVLFDMSPEILTLLQVFMAERGRIINSEYKHVYYILIPCIEYFVLKEFAYPYLDAQIQDVLDFKIHFKECVEFKKIKSFEVFCKKILDSNITCLSQKEKVASYYETSCFCRECSYDEMRCVRETKSKRLVDALPVHIVPVQKSKEDQNEFLLQLQTKYIDLYNEWVQILLSKKLIKWDTSVYL